MKKIFLMGAVLLGLTACNLDTTENVMDIKSNVMNHFSPIGEGDPFVGTSQYSFSLDMDGGDLSFWTSDLGVSGSSSFTSSTIGFKISSVSTETGISEIIRFSKEGNASVNGGPISDVAGQFTTNYFIKEGVNIPGYPVLVEGPRRLVMNYNLADKYVVHTFPADAFYGGETVTVDDSGTSFASDKMIYRLAIDYLTNTADLIMYDCRFSEKMKISLVALVIEDLDFKVTASGYEVTGENKVPLYLEGNSLTEFRGFIFESVSLKTTDADLTSIKIDYDVRNAGSNALYKGSFGGSYIIM